LHLLGRPLSQAPSIFFALVILGIGSCVYAWAGIESRSLPPE
jgi:hypothetical protein